MKTLTWAQLRAAESQLKGWGITHLLHDDIQKLVDVIASAAAPSGQPALTLPQLSIECGVYKDGAAFEPPAMPARGVSPVSAAVPDGYVLVPTEPTPSMLAAPDIYDSPTDSGTRRVYLAMLAARPLADGEGAAR